MPAWSSEPPSLLGAAAIILVHNHPGGSLEPSADDMRVTARLASAGRLLGMDVLDHLILASAGRYEEEGFRVGSSPGPTLAT